VVSTMLLPRGLTFGATSFYYDLIIKGRVPLSLDYYWYKRGVVIMLLVIVTFITNE